MEFRLTQRHIVAFNFLLIAGIAYFVARSVNDIFLQSLQGAPPIPALVSADTGGGTENHPRAYYDQIVSRDIFNLTPQAASEPVVTTVDLHLKLLGTSLATRDKPFAIIEDQAGEQSLYTLGDDIPAAGRLVSVQKSRIIIEHEGQQVALEFPSDDLPGGVESAPVTQSLTGRRKPMPPGAVQRGKGKGDDDDEPDIDVEEEGENRYGLKRNEIKDALAHSASLFTEIRAVPNIQNGKQTGFTLSDIEPGSVFEDLGLEEGDQLTEIDGKQLENPGEAIGLLSTIQTRSSINITVLRDGHPVQLQYNIR